MSRFERNRISNLENPSKKAFFSAGTTLAKQKGMKRTITSKEITLIIGILVAVAIAMTLWLSHPQESSTQSLNPSNVNPTTVKNVIVSTFKIIF